MKNIFKLFLLLITAVFVVSPAFCKIIIKENKFESAIKASELNKTATVAVSVREAKSGSVVFEHNQDKLLHPASTMKMFTTPAAINVLGADYSFKTQLYLDADRNVYLKLAADPTLTSTDLKYLVRNLKSQGLKNVKNIYIDDSILDRNEWGTGWMWDDDTNPYMPKFSAYNLDDNTLKIDVSKDPSNGAVSVDLQCFYPVAIVNEVKAGPVTKVDAIRYNWQSTDIIELKGTVNAPVTVSVPVSNMRRYFTGRLSEYLTRDNIKYSNENFTSAIVPKNAKLIGQITHSSDSVVPLILKNSNNKASETLCKVAGAKAQNATGTNDLTVKMIKDFYSSISVPTDKIVIADASGVSRNNLLSADWMSSALSKMYSMDNFNYIQDKMAQPGYGTLNNRLYDLRGNVWLKTGTISNISGITGYVKAKDDKMYAVSILIQNFTQPQKDAKALEDSIINIIYAL